jgi:hypothetical protein
MNFGMTLISLFPDVLLLTFRAFQWKMFTLYYVVWTPTINEDLNLLFSIVIKFTQGVGLVFNDS